MTRGLEVRLWPTVARALADSFEPSVLVAGDAFLRVPGPERYTHVATLQRKDASERIDEALRVRRGRRVLLRRQGGFHLSRFADARRSRVLTADRMAAVGRAFTHLR